MAWRDSLNSLTGTYRRLVERESSPASRSGAPSPAPLMASRTLSEHGFDRSMGLSHAREAVIEDWYWSRVNTTGAEEDYFWRRLSDNWTNKDVLPGTYLEIHNQCYEAYNANPMANAIVELGVNFVLGDGLAIDAKNKKVQRILDAFWSDPDNHMDLRQYQLTTELSLYGELFIRFFVNPFDGHVKIAQIDPSLIDDIETDPDNIEHELRVHRRALGPLATHPQTTGASLDPGVVIPAQWFTVPDEVMHFAVNRVTAAKRGKSDLATLLPWLRRYKDWLIDRVRINKYKSAFLWDVTLSGADRKTIEQKAMEYARPPEPGSVLIHNESEVWQAVQPNIDAGDVEADGHAMKMMVAMGAGLPEHFLSEGGDVNRATAAEMGLPTLKRYQRRQDYIGHILRAILDRVISEAQTAGTLPKGVDTTYEIHFPQLYVDDAQAIGMASWHMAQALQIARGSGIVSQQTATELFLKATREEYDSLAELTRLFHEHEHGAIQTPDGPLPVPQGSPPTAHSSIPPSPSPSPAAGSGKSASSSHSSGVYPGRPRAAAPTPLRRDGAPSPSPAHGS